MYSLAYFSIQDGKVVAEQMTITTKTQVIIKVSRLCNNGEFKTSVMPFLNNKMMVARKFTFVKDDVINKVILTKLGNND